MDRRTAIKGFSLGSLGILVAACGDRGQLSDSSSGDVTPSSIAKWTPRFDHQTRPVIGVLAANSGTELADFAVPFGVLSAADVAEIITVSTQPGPVSMGPGVQTRTHLTVNQFDKQHPDGADYLIVPALQPTDDPAAIAWIRAQAEKGSSILSICNGALTVAATGLMDGRHATAHWASETRRRAEFPNVHWRNNVRYIADGPIVSSSGISAAMPVSIALIAAIAGASRADSVAESMGARDWGPVHDSDSFRRGPTLDSIPRPTTLDAVGIVVGPGTDEIAFALVADAYSHNGRTRAHAVSRRRMPVKTRRGMTILPDRASDDPALVDVVTLPEGTTPMRTLDDALASIEKSYGVEASTTAARVMEYPEYFR